MNFRIARENEIERITSISKAAFDSDVLVGNKQQGGPPEYDSCEWHRKMLQEGHLFVLESEQEVIAGAILFRDNQTLYIGRIFVSPNQFRKGIGMQLMKEIETYFADVEKIALDTPVWNVRTNRFYKKCQYKEVKRDEESVYYEKNVSCVF